MLFAGFNVSEGDVLALGGRRRSRSPRTSSARGSPTAIGYFGRIELLEQHGKWLHIKPSHLEWADRWFERYGAPPSSSAGCCRSSAPSSRCPAGVARMPFWRFTRPHASLGCLPWMFGLTFAGKQAGGQLGGPAKDYLH